MTKSEFLNAYGYPREWLAWELYPDALFEAQRTACDGDGAWPRNAPVGFKNIRLQFTLDTDASDEQLATLLRLTERYCVVYQTLANPPALAVTRKRATA